MAWRGQLIQYLPLVVVAAVAQTGRQQQPVAQNLGGGKVYQVPVVGLSGILQIERQYLVAVADGLFVICQSLRGLSLKLCHEYQQSAEPHFVPMRHQQLRHLAKGEVLGCEPDDLTRLRHLQSQEFVALAIFARFSLEEAHQHSSLLIVA